MRSDTEVARLIDQGLSTPNLTAILGQCLVAGVMSLDHEGRITFATPEIETWTGLKTDQLIGQGIAVLPAPLRHELEDFYRAGSAVVRKTIEIEVPGGRPRAFQMMALRPPACAPRMASLCTVVLNDITAVETLETGLELLEKLASIATLSASMAHEIKNAMVAVKTFADVLLKKSQDAELAGLAVREIKRIDSIVSQIMRFSGPAKPTFAAVSVHQLIEQALGIVRRPLEAKRIRLVQLLQARQDVIKGDAYQLEQALLNFFFNALEAMGPEGELRVATRNPVAEGELLAPVTPPTRIEIVVSDTGVGIPAENLPRLFEPFFTTKRGGNGLGLSITRRIVEEHQGQVRVESEPGCGTSFFVTLPLIHPRAFNQPVARRGLAP